MLLGVLLFLHKDKLGYNSFSSFAASSPTLQEKERECVAMALLGSSRRSCKNVLLGGSGRGRQAPLPFCSSWNEEVQLGRPWASAT